MEIIPNFASDLSYLSLEGCSNLGSDYPKETEFSLHCALQHENPNK